MQISFYNVVFFSCLKRQRAHLRKQPSEHIQAAARRKGCQVHAECVIKCGLNAD